MNASCTATKAAIGKNAIVLGASMAPLLTARVLADFYTTVTVIERDTPGDSLTARRGVPQGRQTHGLLMRGAEALEELFPGIAIGARSRRCCYGVLRNTSLRVTVRRFRARMMSMSCG